MLFFDNQAKLEEATLEPNGQPVQVKGGVTIGDGLARNYVIYTQDGFREASGLPSWTPDGTVLTLANGALAIPYEMVQGAPVTSVAGRAGDVVLTKSDITDLDEADYATAAQGAKADSALQDASAFATAAQGVKADTALQPEDAASFATALQGAKADSALQPTDTIDADTLEGSTKAEIISTASAGAFDPTSDQNITGDWDFGATLTKASSPVLAEDDIYGAVGQVKAGDMAGETNQDQYAVALGSLAGKEDQSETAIAIGRAAGKTSQGFQAVAIGRAAGEVSQGANSVAIGRAAGKASQGSYAVATGESAGEFTQGDYSVALGSYAGRYSQGANGIIINSTGSSINDANPNHIHIKTPTGGIDFDGSTMDFVAPSGVTANGSPVLVDSDIYGAVGQVSIGTTAVTQGDYAVAMGRLSGVETQGARSVAIGEKAGRFRQGINAVSVGRESGETDQQEYAVAIGSFAGKLNQSGDGVAIGRSAGTSGQGLNSIAVGRSAGEDTQGLSALAIGAYSGRYRQGDYAIAGGGNAGNTDQGDYAIALGNASGQTLQGGNSVAIGRSAGNANQATNAIAVGYLAGSSTQGTYSAAIGAQAGEQSQGDYSIAMGASAGYQDQGNYAIAMGSIAGQTTQGDYSIAIGRSAGNTLQSANAVAIGRNSGQANQGADAVSVGIGAGQTDQAQQGVAVGLNAGKTRQLQRAVAVGAYCAEEDQGDYSIAMGWFAGRYRQGTQAVALGRGAGENDQGTHGVAIGKYAGQTNQGEYGIIINATGAALDDTAADHIHIKTPSGGFDFDGTTMDVVASGGLTVNGAPISGGGGGTVISSNTAVNASNWATFIDLYSLYRSVTYDNGAVVTIRLTADLVMTSSFELGGACDNIVVDMQGFDIATGNYELTKHLGGTAKIKGHGDITTNNNYKAIVVSNGSIVFTGTGTQTASYNPAMNELDVTIGTTLRLRTASGQTWGTKPLLDIYGNGRVYAKDLTFGVAGVLSSGGGQAIDCEGNGSFSGKFIRQYESALSWNRAADGGRIIIVGGVQQNTVTYMNSHNNAAVGNGSIVSLSNYDGTHFGTTHATAQQDYKEKQWYYDNATSTNNSHPAYYGSGYDSKILWGGEYAKILPNPKSSELEFTSHAALCSAIGVSNFTPTNGVAPSAAFQDAFRAYILNNAYNPALSWGMRTGDPDNEMKILLGSGNGHYRATGAYYKNPNIFAVEWKWYSTDAEKGRNDWGEQSTFASEDGGHVALSHSHIGEVGTIFSGGNIGMRTDESTCTAHSVGIYETNARAFYFAGGHVDVGRSEVINTTTGWVKQATYTNQCTGKMWVNITATTGDANQGSSLFVDESNMTVKATVTYGGIATEGCIWFRDSNVVGSITCNSAYDIGLKMESSTYNGGMSIVDAGGSRYSISKSTFNGDITVSGTGSAGTFTNSTHNGSVI